MNQNILHHDDETYHLQKILQNQSDTITITYSDLNQFIIKFKEFGTEITELRDALLAHQSKIRRLLLDSGGDILQ